MSSLVDEFVRPKVTIFGRNGFLSWDAYEALKGLLILLIVIGHNGVFNTLIVNIDWYLYNFHVSSFLMLSFLFKPEAFTKEANRDKLIRYLVPFIIVVLFVSPIKWLFQDASFSVWTELEYTLEGLIFGTAPLLKLATGFSLFWFLPTIALLVVVRSWYYWLPSRSAKWALLSMIGVEFAISWYQPAIDFMPFGFPIVLYIFPLGIIGVNLARTCLKVDRQWMLFAFLLVILYALEAGSYMLNSRLGLAQGEFENGQGLLP
jgi:fucose 4-O-acetylase-like acetyltransferase